MLLKRYVKERCEYAIVGHTTMSVKLYDEQNKNYPVDVPLSMLFGDLDAEMEVKEFVETFNDDNSEDIDLSNSIAVLQHPTVSSKSF